MNNHKEALRVAIFSLISIASTPRNRGARRMARATLDFLETQFPEMWKELSETEDKEKEGN